MRCRGLTDSRRRCESESAGETGYCVQHKNDLASIRPAADVGKGNGGGIGTILGRLRGNSSQLVVPDSAKYDVPHWLKKLPAQRLFEHLLNDPDSSVRWCAAFTLRKRRDPAAIEALWQVMHVDAVSLVRQQAAVALGKIGTEAVAAPLIEGLWHDSDPGVRQACAIALGNLRFRTVAQDVAAVLTREQAAFVRWDCVLALGQIGDQTVEPLLLQLASSERTQVVRQACREALAALS